MRPPHFNCKIMFHVLYQRHTQGTVEVKKEEPTLLTETARLMIWVRSLKILMKKEERNVMQKVQGES